MLTCFKVLFTSATESVITQSFKTAGALVHASVLLASKRALKAFSSFGRFKSLGRVVRNSFQALPHLTSGRAGVIRFNNNFVLMLYFLMDRLRT